MKYATILRSFIVFCLICSLGSIAVYGQIQSLERMASGVPEQFIPLIDREKNVRYYISINRLGLKSQTQMGFEYVLFDPQLVPKMNGEVSFDKKSLVTVYAHLDVHGDVIFRPLGYLYGEDYLVRKKLDVAKNEVVDLPIMRVKHNGDVIELPWGLKPSEYNKPVKKEYNKNLIRCIWDYNELEDGSAVVLCVLRNIHGDYSEPMMHFYDNNGSLLWSRNLPSFDPEITKLEPSVAHVNQDRVCINIDGRHHLFNEDLQTLFYECYDLPSGELSTEDQRNFAQRTKLNSQAHHIRTHREGDRYISIGTLSHKLHGSGLLKGFFRLDYDAVTGDKVYNELLFKDLSDYMELKGKGEKGKVKNGGYRLRLKEVLSINGNEQVLLIEEYKKQSTYGGIPVEKTSDYYLIATDSNFHVIDVHRLAKNPTVTFGGSYHFTQVDDGRVAVVFLSTKYHPEKITKKVYAVTIVTYVDGEIDQFEMPMGDHKEVIVPMPAKKGYILINQINRKEGKYEVRLERINY